MVYLYSISSKTRPAFSGSIRAGILVLLSTVVAFAQASSGTASISGLISDASGGGMPGVEVQVRSTATGVARTVQSNEVGRYEIMALQPGDYEIAAAKEGFATLLRKGITIAVGRRAVADLTMQVSATTSTVTVDANASVVETGKNGCEHGGHLKDVMNLPMNGRRWDAFHHDHPGSDQRRS